MKLLLSAQHKYSLSTTVLEHVTNCEGQIFLHVVSNHARTEFDSHEDTNQMAHI